PDGFAVVQMDGVSVTAFVAVTVVSDVDDAVLTDHEGHSFVLCALRIYRDGFTVGIAFVHRRMDSGRFRESYFPEPFSLNGSLPCLYRPLRGIHLSLW